MKLIKVFIYDEIKFNTLFFMPFMGSCNDSTDKIYDKMSAVQLHKAVSPPHSQGEWISVGVPKCK